MGSTYSFNVQLDKANKRLKLLSVRLMLRGTKIYIEAVLPPKPGSDKLSPLQQRVSTRFSNTAAGLAGAEKMARRLRRELDTETFVWENWSKGRKARQKKKAETCKEWIDLFQADWEKKRDRPNKAWQTDWWPYFKELPPKQPLSEITLKAAVLTKEKDSCSRMKSVERLTALAKFAGVECDLSPYKGTYSPNAVNPRSIPPDEWIEKIYWSIEDPKWQRVYGLMACYGFRNSELGALKFDDYPIIMATQTKTGVPRPVAPSSKRWAKEWELVGELPNYGDRRKLGRIATQWFKRRQFVKPNGDLLKAYDLRHRVARAWAERGATADLAARMMGHTPEIHSRVYRRFIGDQVWLDRAMALD